MAVRDGDTLKSYFALSNVPTPSQYGDLVDTLFDQGSNANHHHDTLYVSLSVNNTILAVHTFNPSIAGPPFLLGPNAYSQTVPYLKADQLNKSISVSGFGLSGGGSLSDNVGIWLASSSNPGVAASILASDSAGVLTLQKLCLLDSNHSIRAVAGQGVYIDTYLVTDPLFVEQVSGKVKLSYGLYTDLIGDRDSDSNLTLMPGGDLILDPDGLDVRPYANYEINLGAIDKKFLALHAAELWVETLVAQNTIATIGGRILVGATTTLTQDVVHTNLYANPGFETVGGGGVDVFASWDETFGNGQIYRDTSIYHGSVASAKMESVTGASKLEQYISCVPGYSYTISFWTRGDGTHSGSYGVFSDHPGTPWLYDLVNTGITDTSWTRIQFTIYPPTGTSIMSLVLYSPSVNGGICWYDDVIVSFDTVYTKHNQMAIGDFVYLEANGKVEWMKILDGPYLTGPYSYVVQRDLDGSGINDWYAGDAIFNTGPTGGAYIDIYSYSSIRGSYQIGPTISGHRRWGSTYSTIAEIWALGNLNGMYGYSSTTFGVGLGMYGWGWPYLTIDVTNGIRMQYLDGSGTNHIKGSWDMSGNITVGETSGGNVYISSSGLEIKYGSTTVIKLDTSGNALFGREVSSYSNVKWNASNQRLEFRTNTTVKSYIDTDGAFVVNTVNDYWARAEAITWNNGSADIATLGAYDSASLQGVELKTIPVAGKVSSAYLMGLSSSTTTATATVKAGNDSSYASMTLATITDGGKVDFTLDKLYLGSNTRPAEVWITGDMVRWLASGLTYIGYIYHPLAVYVAAWTDTTYGNIGADNFFTAANLGVPSGTKAVMIEITAYDTGTWGTNGIYVALGPSNSYWFQLVCRPAGGSVQAEAYGLVTMVDDKIYVREQQSGTIHTWIKVWGYCV